MRQVGGLSVWHGKTGLEAQQQAREEEGWRWRHGPRGRVKIHKLRRTYADGRGRRARARQGGRGRRVPLGASLYSYIIMSLSEGEGIMKKTMKT